MTLKEKLNQNNNQDSHNEERKHHDSEGKGRYRPLLLGIMEKVLQKYTRDQNLVNNIFHLHKVIIGNCCQWSRESVKASATIIFSERETQLYRELDLGADEKEKKMDGQKEKELIDVQNERTEIRAQQETCKELQTEEETKATGHHEELETLQAEWKKTSQNDKPGDFEDFTVVTDEMIEEGAAKQKDKSIRRRFLNWLDELIHEHIRKKIEQTYVQELEEGHQFYKTNFYFFYPMTRGQRERQKRREWVHRDNQRQRIKTRVDAFFEEQCQKKEALRLEEEERFEKWAAEHDVSISTCQSNEPKRRMSKWKKRCLRVREFFHQAGSQ